MKYLKWCGLPIFLYLIIGPISGIAQEESNEPYTILEELELYEQEASYEEFQLIDYFGVIDARITVSGENLAGSDTTERKLDRSAIINYSKNKFNESFKGIKFNQVPKEKVLELLDNRDPDRHEIGLIILEVSVSAYKKIAALNVTMQAGNLRTIEIWKKTEGEYFLREEVTPVSRVEKVIDDLMVQLAIDFYKSRLGIY